VTHRNMDDLKRAVPGGVFQRRGAQPVGSGPQPCSPAPAAETTEPASEAERTPQEQVD
jgi:hypothetical protein